MIRNVRHLLHRGGSTTSDDQIIVDALNHGHRQLHSEVLFDGYRKWVTYSIVANEQNYLLPSDFIASDLLSYKNNLGTLIPEVTQHELMIAYTQPYERSAERPRFYTTLYEKGSEYLQLFPRPSTAAPATTLNGAINASVTTVTLTDSTNFPSKGRLIVNSEVIEFNANDTSTGQLTGCTRGVEGTTAASHLDTDAVTMRDLNFYYWSTADDLDDDADVPLYPETYHMLPVFYAAWFVLVADGVKPEQSAQYLQQWEQGKLLAKRDVSMRRRDNIARLREWRHDPGWKI